MTLGNKILIPAKQTLLFINMGYHQNVLLNTSQKLVISLYGILSTYLVEITPDFTGEMRMGRIRRSMYPRTAMHKRKPVRRPLPTVLSPYRGWVLVIKWVEDFLPGESFGKVSP